MFDLVLTLGVSVVVILFPGVLCSLVAKQPPKKVQL